MVIAQIRKLHAQSILYGLDVKIKISWKPQTKKLGIPSHPSVVTNKKKNTSAGTPHIKKRK